MSEVSKLVEKWNADAASDRDDAYFARAGGIEDCADELKAALASDRAAQGDHVGDANKMVSAAQGGGPVPALDASMPERIWLQIDTSGDNERDRDEAFPADNLSEVSWHWEQIGGVEVEYVRADLYTRPAAEAVGVWQPIETAPKSQADGSRIEGVYLLGFIPDADLLDGQAQIDVIWWEPLLPNAAGTRGKWCANAFGDSVEVRPTLWMPLPASPSQPEGVKP